MRKLNVAIAFFSLLIAHSDNAYAGAWVQPKGRSLHIMKYYFYTTDDQFEGYGDLDSLPNDGRFTKNEINYYVEVGATDKLTLIGNFFYDFLKYKDDFVTNTNNGFSDQEIGARYNIISSPVVFSVQGSFIFPAYSSDDALKGNSPPEDEPALGNQDIGLEARLLLGKGFMLLGIPAYTNLEAGVRFRIGDPSDQIRYQTLFGIKPGGWEIMLFIDGIEGLRNEDEVVFSENVTVIPDFSLIKGTVAVVIPIYKNRVSLELGGFWHLLGRNTGGGGGVESGIWLRF
ncbi:MAG TPA: hypothetical protein VLB01_00210 [Thermodesulfobacteriota bacterium]|nr:hypothetical protein [Thermodesulfobacteriota bacterium]